MGLADLIKAKDDLVKRGEHLCSLSSLTEAEQTEFDTLVANIETLNKSIATTQAFNERKGDGKTPTIAAVWEPDTDNVEYPLNNQAAPKAAADTFSNFGTFTQAVIRAGVSGNTPDRRLLAIGAGANESNLADGGYFVTTEFANPLFTRVYETGSVYSRVRRIPLTGNTNSITFPAIDETSRANGSRRGGLRGYWLGEGTSATPSYPLTKVVKIDLYKIALLVYLTEELIQDAGALAAWILSEAPAELLFVLEDAIINGTGVGQPHGILGSAAFVSQAKKSGQAANTVVAENILNVFSRMPPAYINGAEWFSNPNVMPQLPLMSISSQPAYLPPTGVSGSMYGTLMGRPINPTEYNPTLGTVGDIFFANLNQYALVTKGGVDQASSMHVRFLQHEQTLRFIMRVGGAPLWTSALTPYKGTDTVSPYIGIETRA